MSRRNRSIVPKTPRPSDTAALAIPKGFQVLNNQLFEVFEEHDGSGKTMRMLAAPDAPLEFTAARSEIGRGYYQTIRNTDRWYSDIAALAEQMGILEQVKAEALTLLPMYVAEAYEQDTDARALVDHLAQALPIEWQAAARSWLVRILGETAAVYALDWMFLGEKREQIFDDLVRGTAANVLADITTGNFRFPPHDIPATLEGKWARAYRKDAPMHFALSRAHLARELANQAAHGAIYPGSIRMTWEAIVAHFEDTYGQPQRRRRKTRKPAPVQPIAYPPAIPTAAGGHYVTHALNPATYAIGRAVSDGREQRDWHDYGGTTVPYHVTKYKAGEIRISKRDESGEIAVSEAVRESLFDQLRSYGPLTRNVFGSLIVIASARSAPFALPLWVSPEDCLDVMGRVPITKPGEPASWSHGHRTEDKLEVCRALLDLSDLHIELVDVEVPGRRGKTDLLNRRGRVLVVTDAEERRPKEAGDIVTSGQRIRVVFGAWVDEFGENGLKQFGLISQKAISYTAPYEAEGGLAWYLAFHFGYDRSGAARPLRRKVGTLLEESGLVQNTRYPHKTRSRLEGALNRLAADGVLGRWKYTTDVDAALPAKNWARDWHEMTVALTPPQVVDDGYAALRQKGGKGARQLPLSTAT